MQLLDLYVLVVRMLGIVLAFYGIIYFTAFASAVSAGFLLDWAFALVVYAAAAVVCLRHPRPIARWLARSDGEKEIALGLSAADLQSVFIFAIGLYIVATGILSLVASVIPRYYGEGILWQGVVRPAVQIIMGVFILTRKRWGPAAARALAAWREPRGD